VANTTISLTENEAYAIQALVEKEIKAGRIDGLLERIYKEVSAKIQKRLRG
jgi:hypothetical protein